MRQCLGLQVDRTVVRRDLMNFVTSKIIRFSARIIEFRCNVMAPKCNELITRTPSTTHRNEYRQEKDFDRRVTLQSYLSVDVHGEAILKSLFRHTTSTLSANLLPEDIRIIALYSPHPMHLSNGGVSAVGASPGRARRTLVVVNRCNQHFDPCLLP